MDSRDPIAISPPAKASSESLQRRVLNFIQLAERVETHPLTQRPLALMNLSISLDQESGQVLGVDGALPQDDPDSWEMLATRERSLLFNETEWVHVTRVASAVRREHVDTRPATKRLSNDYRTWGETPLFQVTTLPTPPPPDLPDGTITSVWIGPKDLRPDVGTTYDTSDIELAKLYLNSRLWHSDEDKAERWNPMTALMQEVCRKAAALRAVSGARVVMRTLGFIRFLRDVGYDF